MENKYFTPDIEDVHVGYELVSNLEKLGLGIGRVPLRISKDNILNVLSNIDNYEVSYLTKEQIEAEGWEQDERYNDEKHFYKNNIYLRLYIGYHYNEIITYNISIFNEDGILFKGKCKDINTFRKIIKLLGI